MEGFRPVASAHWLQVLRKLLSLMDREAQARVPPSEPTLDM
jgi:hypothetical protein